MARAGGTPATTALTRAGVAFTVHTYRHDPSTDDYGAEAARLLGQPGDRVFKTLVTTVDGTTVAAVVPVVTSLDLKALAEAVGGKRAAMAPPALAERVTGYVVGGISPLGQRRQLPTVVDASATRFPTVFVSGGRRGFEVELTCADLVALTAATVAPIARR